MSIEWIKAMKCVVCDTEVEKDQITNYSAFGGLPSPCCKLCFEVNDYSIKDMNHLKARSILAKKKVEIGKHYRGIGVVGLADGLNVRGLLTEANITGDKAILIDQKTGTPIWVSYASLERIVS